MTRSTLRTADDCIRESLDAFMAGDKESAKRYLKEAIREKMISHCAKCLEDVYIHD